MKNEHPAFFPSRTGRYCRYLIEGIAVIELRFYHFPDSDRLRVGSQTKLVWMIGNYGDQSYKE